jgi:chromosome partitioning protein
MSEHGPHIVVVGNEKGGCGKSTTAMHVVTGLLKAGLEVGSIDLDGRQRTFTRYVENRHAWGQTRGLDLKLPEHRTVVASGQDSRLAGEAAEARAFAAALDSMSHTQVVVIDCPGTDTFLSRLAHSYADTLLTPVNDSFIDLDMLARVDGQSFEVLAPSRYSEMVWESRQRRMARERRGVDWIVMRNRLSHMEARNKQRVATVLDNLSRRIGFRLAPGLSERVIYRELFLAGLTLLDLTQKGVGVDLTMSHVAARTEVRALFAALELPGIEDPARL